MEVDKEQKSLLLCVSEESTEVEKIKSILQQAKINYSIFLLNSVENLSSRILSLCTQSYAIFWLGTWSTSFQVLLSVITNSHIKIPIVWLYTEKDIPHLIDAERQGLSAFISTDSSEIEMCANLMGFKRIFDYIEHIEFKLNSREGEITRNETILKQREEFLGICTHDLRAPLGIIQMSLSMILNQESNKKTLSPLYVELLTRAKRQAHIAIKLINDLLDVTAYEHGLKPQYEIVELDKFLTELICDFSLEAKRKNITIHYSNKATHLKILADQVRVRQLLQNLISNAIKFTPETKNIYVNIEPFKGRRKTDPPYSMIIISIKDEGKGIPPRELQKIFDRFSQIKEYNRDEGRGLGLTVAKQISSLHDGNVWVQSVEGQGATFFVLFPHVIGETNASTCDHPKIIVAEKSLDKRPFYGVIEKMGIKVIYVNDGPSAVARTFYELPHALILSNDLTKMSIEEVFNILKSNPKTNHIKIALTTETNNNYETSLDYVFKLPINEEDAKNFIESFKKAA